MHCVSVVPQGTHTMPVTANPNKLSTQFQKIQLCTIHFLIAFIVPSYHVRNVVPVISGSDSLYLSLNYMIKFVIYRDPRIVGQVLFSCFPLEYLQTPRTRDVELWLVAFSLVLTSPDWILPVFVTCIPSYTLL